jgi:small conductance mechanosensitive channel
MAASASPGQSAPNRGAFALALSWILALGIAGAALYYLVLRFHLLPAGTEVYARAGLALAFGILGVVIVGRIIFRISRRFTSPRHAGLITDVYRIAAYAILALVVLYALGVNGYALLAGGTFAGLVIGLAGQTALANVVAGVMLLLARPFVAGDRLTLSSAQFSFLLPSYPPKFYSQDLLIPGFTGVVQDVGLMYTVLRMDEGTTVSLPNSLVILGAVVSHNLHERWVRVKYEVPPSVDPVLALRRVHDAVVADDWVVGKRSVKVLVNQATLTSYVISVDALCAGNMEEPPRSALYLRIMAAISTLAVPGPGLGGQPPLSPTTPTAPPGPTPGSGTANPGPHL